MEKLVFDELMNRGIVTNVGLKAEDYTDMNDLQNKGLATTIGADKVYNKLVEETQEGEETQETKENPEVEE